MSIEYVFGRSGSNKTKYIFSKIKNLLENNPSEKILVFVPEQATFRMERELIENCSLDGLFNLSVLSFDRLVYVLLSELGGRVYKSLDFIGKSMISKNVLSLKKDELKVFSKSASKPGFEIKIAELFSELKRQDVTLNTLENSLNLDLDIIIKDKLSDISLLFESYQNHIKEKDLDSEDLINIAIEKAYSSNFLKDAFVFIDGFDLLTNQVLRLLLEVIKKSKDTTITFRMNDSDDKDKLVFEPEKKLFEMIDKGINDLNLKSTIKNLASDSIDKTKYKSKEIRHLENNLFAYPFKKYDNKLNDITLSSFENKKSEVQDMCSKIISLTNDGLRFRDISVCVSDLSSYHTLIKTAFFQNKIPCFLDMKTKLMQTSFAEFLVGLLDFLDYKDTEDFFIHVKSGFLNIDESNLYLFENYIKKYNIKGYMLKSPFKKADEKIENVRDILASPIFELLANIKKAKTTEQYGELILDYLKSQNVDESIKAFSEFLEEKGDIDSSLIFSQVFEKIIDIIHQSCLIFKDSIIDFPDFVSAIKAGMEAAEIAIIPPSTDEVLVGDFVRTVFPEVKALFILGLNDGKIPSSPDNASILTDSEKIKLERQGIKAGYRDRFFEERMKIYSVFAKPSEKLFLSFSNSGDTGSKKKSVLIGRIQKIFPKLSISETGIRDKVYFNLSKESVYKNLCLALNQNLDGLKITKDWRDVFEWYSNDIDWNKKVSDLKTRLLKTSKSAYIAKQSASILYSPLKTSVSRVERFYDCPFKYFMDYGIKPKKSEEFEESPMDMGVFLHDCLHMFVVKLEEKNIRWAQIDEELLINLVGEVVDELVKTHNFGIFKNNERFSFILERLKLEFLSAVKVIKDQLSNTKVNVYKSELSLQNEEYLKFLLPDGQTITLSCKVDRVDYINYGSSKIVRIIDYKSSGKSISLTEVYFGLNIQLLVYLKFVLEYFKSVGETPVIGGAFYMDLTLPQLEDNSRENIVKSKKMNGYMSSSPDVNRNLSQMDNNSFIAMTGSILNSGEMSSRNKNIYTQDEFDVLFKHCEEKIIEAMDSIMQGYVTPVPQAYRQKSACDYCDYKSICCFDSDVGEYRILYDITKEEFGLKG